MKKKKKKSFSDMLAFSLWRLLPVVTVQSRNIWIFGGFKDYISAVFDSWCRSWVGTAWFVDYDCVSNITSWDYPCYIRSIWSPVKRDSVKCSKARSDGASQCRWTRSQTLWEMSPGPFWRCRSGLQKDRHTYKHQLMQDSTDVTQIPHSDS